METINLGLLLLIILFAIANLVIEINDNITKQYEILYRLLFGSIAVGALVCILYNEVVWIYSLGILVLLVFRYKNKNEHLHH